MGKYITNTYQITNNYQNIFIDAKDAKVSIETSDDINTKLIIYEKKKRPYHYLIQDNELIIKPVKTKGFNLIRVGIDHSEIKLSIPKSNYQNIKVYLNVGYIKINSISCSGTIEIHTNTGSIDLDNISCKDLNSKGNTGSINLNEFTAEDKISIICNTGKVSINECFCPDIYIKTNTGKVSGKLPSNTMFITHTTTGKIVTPIPSIGDTITGRCEIKTNTGSINFE